MRRTGHHPPSAPHPHGWLNIALFSLIQSNVEQELHICNLINRDPLHHNHTQIELPSNTDRAIKLTDTRQELKQWKQRANKERTTKTSATWVSLTKPVKTYLPLL